VPTFLSRPSTTNGLYWFGKVDIDNQSDLSDLVTSRLTN
jgi:hypothetical protein